MATAKKTKSGSKGKRTPPRSERLEVRVTREQKRLLQRKSAGEGKTLSAFVIDSALRAASDEHVIKLSARDSKMVLEMLASPPREPTEAAKRAVKRWQQMFRRG
jgi:uncharacterized protein (DUF1778 family)